jgi:hypothetical protein
MWLVTTAVSAVSVTVLNSFFLKKLKLGFLALLLWGATIMILIDHLLGYEGGEFLERTTDGLIKSGATLGGVMLIPVVVVWLISLLITNLRR